MRSIHSMLPLFFLASAAVTVAVASTPTVDLAQLEQEYIFPEFFLGPKVDACPEGYEKEAVTGVSVSDKKRCWPTTPSTDPKVDPKTSYVYAPQGKLCPTAYRGPPPTGKQFDVDRKYYEAEQANLKSVKDQVETYQKKQAETKGDKTTDNTKKPTDGKNNQLGEDTKVGSAFASTAQGALPLVFVVTAVGSGLLLL